MSSLRTKGTSKMAVKLFSLLLLTVAVYAQEHTTLHPDTREMADIGGKQYWFTNDFVGVEWIGADFACKNQSMVLTSLETQQDLAIGGPVVNLFRLIGIGELEYKSPHGETGLKMNPMEI
ncbi:hypothetical protein B566_EDAN004977 [Ephemera danica]|nr:hypothetical protein B566_EDAN004977 [Ephemera danica]